MALPLLRAFTRPLAPSRIQPLEQVGAPGTRGGDACAEPRSVPCGATFERLPRLLCLVVVLPILRAGRYRCFAPRGCAFAHQHRPHVLRCRAALPHGLCVTRAQPLDSSVPALEDSVVFFVHSVGLSPFSVWPGALALTLRGHPDGCTPLVFTRAQLSPL